MNAQPRSAPKPTPLCPIPRNGIPRIPTFLLFALLTVSAAMVGIGLFTAGSALAEASLIRYGSGAVMLLLALVLWRFTHTSKGIIPILLLVSVAVYYITLSLPLTAALLSLLFAVAEGGFLLAVLPRRQLALFPIIPILAYAAALAVTRDPLVAAASLIPFPPMAALALGTRSSAEKKDGLTRVGVICLTSLTLGISFLAVAVLLLYRSLGSLSPDVLLAAMDSLRAAFVENITSAQIPEGVDPALLAEMEQLLTHASAENMVNSAFNLLPAIGVVFFNLIAAITQMMQHATLRSFGYGDSITPRVSLYRVSLVSCLVFLAAYLIAFFENGDSSTLVGTVAQNISIILMPGLALAGMIRITSAMTRKGPGGMGCLFYLVILIPCLFIIAPFVLAAIEVIGHLFSVITSAIKPDDDDPFGNQN